MTNRGAAVAGRVAELLGPRRPWILAHRGTAGGPVVENTPAAALLAVASGADIVEIDLVCSTDGELFVFHDGREAALLGIDSSLLEMTAAEIEAHPYLVRGPDGAAQPVTRLTALLEALPPSTVLNVDRSWPWWPLVLDRLAEAGDPARFLLKSVPEPAHLDALAGHAVAFPYLAVVRSADELARVLAAAQDGAVAVVAVEVVAHDPHDPLLAAGTVAAIHRAGLWCVANAEVLGERGGDLFGGHDDWRAVTRSPHAGWGPLWEVGVDAVITDFPWLLERYRSGRSGTGTVPEEDRMSTGARA